MSTSIAQKRKRVNSPIAFTCSSYIKNTNAPEPPWIWAPHDFIIFTPPEPDRGSCYAASLAAEDYLVALREALTEGDDLSARMAIHVIRALTEVTLAKLSGSPKPSVH